MNENTTFANSRPRSVKPKKRTGFTMMEMMITLAIMAILFGLAVPAVAVIQKNLEIARLNSYAKDVYLAAQNRLMSLKATGELVELRDALEKDYADEGLARGRYYGPTDPKNMDGSSFMPQDWDTSWGNAYYNFYGIMHNPTDVADNDPISDKIIPSISVTSTSLDHHYYIEFNPLNGDVYAAFYTDAKGGFTAEDIRNLPYAEEEGEDNGRSRAYLRDNFTNGDGEKMMVGYYRGDPTDMLKEKEIKEYNVTCKLVNKEDLYVKVTCDLNEDSPVGTYFLRKFIEASVEIKQVGTGNSIILPISGLARESSDGVYSRDTNQIFVWDPDGDGKTTKFAYYILLDALEKDNVFDTLASMDGVKVNGDLEAFKSAFAAGCDIEAVANLSLDFADRVVRTNTQNNESDKQNSRFGAISGNSVRVGYVRQLKNLNGYRTDGTGVKIEQARVESVKKIVKDEDGEEHEEIVVEAVPADIYFNAKYEGTTNTKWFWESDYLFGEPTGADLKNYLTAFTPINIITPGDNKLIEYNGNDYGLYDFNISGPGDKGSTGLFDTVKNMTFKRVSLIDAVVDGGATSLNVGGLAGYAINSSFQFCGVRLTDRDPADNNYYDDMETRVNTLEVKATGAENIGGMVGFAENTDFDYSYAAVKVEDASSAAAGGLVGSTLNGCDFASCYTSEETVGGEIVGGFIGLMDGGSVKAYANSMAIFPSYSTGDVTGTGIVGGFVGKTSGPAKIYDANSYGRVTGGTTKGGFVGRAFGMSGESFSDPERDSVCAYLKQTRYNSGEGYNTQPTGVVARDYQDAAWYIDPNGDKANSADDSHPYTIYRRATVFPFVMAGQIACNTAGEWEADIPLPHYGDWPLEADLQTMLAYYEVYKEDDGSTRYGFYGFTSMNGDDEEKANSWKVDSLLRGDVECVEDGYAILSTDKITSLSGTIESLNNTAVSVDYDKEDASLSLTFASEGSSREWQMYVYKLSLDAQGMSTAYETKMNDQNGTYFQKLVLTGKNGGDDVFTDYTFFYCPVLAKSAINPTPAQADDPTLCPTAQAKDSTDKPDAGIIRSARQLNAMGRMNWFWNMDLNQECHVNFGTYVKNYCGTAIDLSGSGQTTSNQWRNKPIGSNTTTYGKKPYTGNYNGNAFKIIDYCLLTSEANDSVDAGLFGVLYKGSIKNVVLMASDPNANSGAGTAWVKSTMTQGNGAYHIAPLVGLVDYNSDAYSAAGSQARSIKTWTINSDAIDRYAIEGNKFSLSGYNSVGDGGRWNDAKRNLAPQNTQEYMEITLKGNFGTVTGATMTSTKTVNGSPVTYSGPTSASSIKDGEIKFRLEMTDCTLETSPESVDPNTGEVTPASSKRNVGDDIVITLTGGDLTNWAVSNSSFMAEKFSTEPVVPTGDDPANYITGIANMSTVSNCAVAGYIVDYTPNGTQNNEVQIGGLVGKNQGEIYNCSASNKRLSADGSSNAARLIGGFAGDNKEGVIADCYSGGLLYAGGTQSAYVGGIVGKNEKGENRAWRPAYTQLLNCYSYCSMENNDSSNIHYYGVAGGNNSVDNVKHCHFTNYLPCFKDYSKDDRPFTALYNKLEDRDKTYTTTIRGESVTIPYVLTYTKMKALARGNEYALSGTTGTADFDHTWPYDQTLAGNFPFPAVVLDDDGYYVHYGDWPAPIGSTFSNSTSFGGVFWADFCVDATHKTDYNYYWGDWLKEMMYQSGLGDFKEGDFIEIIVEPEFKYDAPEAGGLFQCAVHSMLTDTSKNVWDDENDAAYEAQGVTFGNGQVYQFLFDVDKQTINILNDPQLWFAINYHQKGGIDASLWEGVKGNYFDEDGEPAGNEDPFRINHLTVNVYRDSSSSSTTNKTTRHSTTGTSAGQTTSEEELTHLETLKTWDFEPVNGEAAKNILSTGEGSMVAGVISDDLYAGNADSGHSNKISLNKAKDFRMNISDAFNNEQPLGANEYYQVEATFALGDNATDNLYIRPYLVSGSDSYYASNYTLVQKRATEGANKGKVIWATALYTFGQEGQVIDDDAYIVWIPREVGDQTNPKTLTGDLYVDNVAVKKVVPGADPSATSETKATVPASDDEAKLIYYWACDQASTIVLPTYDVSPKNTYRYINVGGKDLTTGVSWSDFLKMHDSLTETQYMVVTLEYPEGYAHAEKSNFTFTCDAYAYGDNQTLAEIDAASGDDAFDAENHTVKWVINGPVSRSAGANYGGAVTLKTYFAYRNAQDLLTNRTLIDNEKDFNITVGIYDRDPNATAMTVPTTTASRITKQLSGGTAVHTFAADQLGDDNYMSFSGSDKGYVDNNRTTVMTWNEFVNYVGALGDTQYLRVTITNNDAAFSGLNLVDQTITANAYRGVDGKIIKGEPAKLTNATTIVYQVNGPLDLNTVATDGAKEGYNDAGIVFGGMPDALRVGDKTSILVEIMSTATTAQLQGDSFDVLADDVVSKTVTITLDGDTFSSGLVLNSDITHWFNGVGGRGLSAKLLSVNGNMAQVSIVGTVTEAPASDVTVTVTVPGDATTKGGNDIVASGSFIISKKEPKASIVGDETVRSFFVNEVVPNDGHAKVNISVANTTITDNLGSVGDWYTGTLPIGLELSQVAKINDNTVTLTFSGTPTDQCSVPLTFKVPAVAVACDTELTAGTLTFNVVSRPEVTVTFGLKEGTYKGTRTVSISSDPTDATIEYNLDNSGWESYVLPVDLTEGEHTLYARATKTGYKTVEAQATYTILHDDNLIRNGYFDDGMDGWTFTPASTNVKVVNGVLTVTDYAYSNDLNITASLKDDVTLKPDTKYRLSFIMNAGTGLTVKVNPGGNNSISYTESGSYEFTTGPKDEMGKFKIYIAAPKDKAAVSGTFDEFVLTEVGGGSETTTYTVTVTNGSASPTSAATGETVTLTANAPQNGKVFDKWVVTDGGVTLADVSSATTTFVMGSKNVKVEATYKDSGTSSDTSASSTSEPTGERTKKAQWVTTGGVSYAYYKENDRTAKVQVWENCDGKIDGTTNATWMEFLASVGNVSANQYFEIAFTHKDDSSFHGVVNDGTKTTMDNTGYSPTTTTLLSADDLKVLFETNGALTYQGINNPHLEALFVEANGAAAQADIICTVTLWEGDHGGSGGETSESDPSTSETEPTQSQPSDTPTNLIVNGTFSSGLNDWKVNGNAENWAVQTGQLTFTASSSMYAELLPTLVSSLETNKTYTIAGTITSTSANDKIYFGINKANGSAATDGRSVAMRWYNGTFKATFSTGGDTTNFIPKIYQDKDAQGVSFAIDNLWLVEGDGSDIPSGGDPTEEDTYTVTVTGGNADKTTAAAGETITLTPPTTAPEGQEFKGWKVTAGGVTVTNNTFTMPAANVTIEAEYQYIEYSITVYNGNANGKTTAHAGETIQLNAGAPGTGKVFAGWTVTSPAGLTLADASATMTTFTMPAADVVVEAKMDWVEHNITIYVNNDAWGSASILTGVTKAHFGEQLTLKVTPADGYELKAISVKNNVMPVGADNKFSMPDTDVDIYVDFVKSVVPTHNVTITGGIVTGKTGSETIAEGETVTITASGAGTGETFTGWTVNSPSGLTLVDASASTTSFTMPKADVAITANFAKQNYNVTIGTVQNGTISANKTTAQYGDAVTLTATPATGYVFKSWSVNGGTLDSASANPATLTMPASDVIVTATFEKQTYAVTVSNDTTKGTASASVSTAAYGDTVTLTASAKTGYTFSGWTSSDDVTITNASSSSASFTMPAKAVTVTANYVVDPNAAIASWTTTSGISRTYYNGGTSTMEVAYNTTGLDNNHSEISFEGFVNSNTSIGASQYMKITYTKSNGKFGNARRASTALAMNAYSGGSYKVAYADDATITVYVKGAASKTTDPSFATSWTNASAVPDKEMVTCKVEIFNFTTDPLASISETDKTQNYTVTVTGGTASPASAAPGTSVTVTPTVESGTRFTEWTVDGIDYLYDATVAPGSTANPLTFTMPYNNVKLTANFETVETEPTQPPVTGNLIKNGDFSNDKADWTPYGVGSFEVISGVAHVTAGSTDDKGINQVVTLEVDKTYVLSGDVTGSSMIVINGVSAQALSGGHFSYSFKATRSDTTVTFGGSKATFTLDNVVLVEEGGSTPTQSQPSDTPTNLIKNGDFSSGMSGGAVPDWTLSEGGMQWTITDGKLTFNNAAYIHTVLKPDLVTALKANTTYTIAGDITATAGNDKICLRIAQPNGNSLTDNSGATMKWNNGSFKSTFTTGGTPENFVISLYAGRDGVSALSFAIDNLWLVEGDGSNIPSGGGESSQSQPSVTNPPVGGGTLTVDVSYPIKYKPDGHVTDSKEITSGTATVAITFEGISQIGAKTDAELAAFVSGMPVAPSTITRPGGNDGPVTFVYTIAVTGDTTLNAAITCEAFNPSITIS